MIGEKELFVFVSASLAHLPPHLVHVRVVAVVGIIGDSKNLISLIASLLVLCIETNKLITKFNKDLSRL